MDPSAYVAPDGVAFATTDANTVCTISGTASGEAPTASCSISQKDFAFSPSTAATSSSAVTVSGAAKGTTTLTDVTASGATALAAGRSITWSTVTCVAIENGIRCTNAATSHGFFLSRIKYELF